VILSIQTIATDPTTGMSSTISVSEELDVYDELEEMVSILYHAHARACEAWNERVRDNR
jgi:hypothetical protein